MVIIDNTKENNQISIYGTQGADLMLLVRVQDSKNIEVPIVDLSLSDRFGTFIFSYSADIPENTCIVESGKTIYNLIPGKYNYNISGIRGILNVISEKEQNKIYEDNNTTKIYSE